MARMVALGAEQSRIAGKLRRQAAAAETDHPTMQIHGHLRDAATQLERGKHEAAERHVRAAIQSLTPLQLVRHGHTTDDEHTTGKEHMALLTRHLLNIKDISDTADANRNLRAAMNAPASTPLGRPDGTARGPGPITAPAGHPKPARSWIAAGQQSAGPKLMAADWALVDAIAIELSAETARLAVTPAPRGKPGGPGLYDVKGMGHTAYLQQVVKALIEKRGMEPGKAYAIARASIRKWMAKSKHPEVKAAAGAAEAGELARQAAAHTHANEPQHVIDLFNPNHSATGQFTTANNAQQGKGKQGKGSLNTRATRMSNAQRARAKGQLLQKAHADFAKAAGLRAQIRALLAQLHGSSGSTAASSGATKAASSSTKAAASATKGASTAKAGSSKASSSTAKSASQIRSQVAGLRAQVSSLMAAGRAAQAQAAKL